MREYVLDELNDEDIAHFLRDFMLYLIEERGADYAYQVAEDILEYVSNVTKPLQ